MDAHRARAGTTSRRRTIWTLALSVVVASAWGIAGPAAAVATENVDSVEIRPINFILPARQIVFLAGRTIGNPADPVTVTATEAADGRSVTITDVSRAAGGFVASAPCEKTEAQTAVCPTHDASGNAVTQVQVDSAVEGENSVTVEAPTLKALVLLGEGNDTASVPRSRESSISAGAGNDTLTGGTGVDSFFADGGRDTIFAFDEPAQQDFVSCGVREVESPVDIAHVDSADTLVNSNCGRVIRGP